MSPRKPPRPILGPSAFLDQAAGAQSARPADPARAPGQAEASHFQKLVEARCPVHLGLRDGTSLTGILEWHDRGALRLNVPEGHIVVPKTALASIERVPELPA